MAAALESSLSEIETAASSNSLFFGFVLHYESQQILLFIL